MLTMQKPIVLKADLTPAIADDFRQRSELGVDCEMMGLNPYRDRLCVVQIASERGPCAIVQIDEAAGAPLLKEVMESKTSAKIFHYARMDIMFLYKRVGIDVQNVFCTKIASRLARTYTDRHGLKDVVREMAGETMDKTSQSSDWGRETLSEDQVTYAADDVRYLFEIKRRLTEILRREKRIHLAESAFAFLPTRRELDLLGYEDIFTH